MAGRAGSDPPPPKKRTQHFAFNSMHTNFGAAQQHSAHLRLLPPRALQTALQALSWQLQGSWEPSPLSRAGKFLFIALTLYLGVLLL